MISTFANKLKEISRGVTTSSEIVEKVFNNLSKLGLFLADLSYLADELDVSEEEKEEILELVDQYEDEMTEHLTSLLRTKKELGLLAQEILGDSWFGPYLDREVSNVSKGVFTYKESSVSTYKDLIKLGSENPELREHIRPLLDKLKISHKEDPFDSGRIEVDLEDFHWGTLRTVHVGNMFKIVLHPEDWEKVKHGGRFKDETGRVWQVKDHRDELEFISGNNQAFVLREKLERG